jgi:hypothetical protein
MKTTTLSAAASGTFKLGNDLPQRLGFGAMRITGKGICGRTGEPGRGTPGLTASGRTWHQVY